MPVDYFYDEVTKTSFRFSPIEYTIAASFRVDNNNHASWKTNFSVQPAKIGKFDCPPPASEAWRLLQSFVERFQSTCVDTSVSQTAHSIRQQTPVFQGSINSDREFGKTLARNFLNDIVRARNESPFAVRESLSGVPIAVVYLPYKSDCIDITSARPVGSLSTFDSLVWGQISVNEVKTIYQSRCFAETQAQSQSSGMPLLQLNRSIQPRIRCHERAPCPRHARINNSALSREAFSRVNPRGGIQRPYPSTRDPIMSLVNNTAPPTTPRNNWQTGTLPLPAIPTTNGQHTGIQPVSLQTSSTGGTSDSNPDRESIGESSNAGMVHTVHKFEDLSLKAESDEVKVSPESEAVTGNHTQTVIKIEEIGE